MANSKQLAGLIGPTLIVLSITEAMNLQIFASNIPPVVYLNGTILFLPALQLYVLIIIGRGVGPCW